ncbi:unnamed protein product [Lepeophtheirus salmonis]|uniref:(salmon louse) hypothetical protein n=1 Tax=Lepeophtheirus salmonis TaxID=72036 RepID=A0A7R8CZS9_LEPSM|nr:unnamed protein product [Lepeophtheirus salmonis]CAF2977709.1 unnamed protein product [Lepeophtheirus salmonis]
MGLTFLLLQDVIHLNVDNNWVRVETKKKGPSNMTDRKGKIRCRLCSWPAVCQCKDEEGRDIRKFLASIMVFRLRAGPTENWLCEMPLSPDDNWLPFSSDGVVKSMFDSIMVPTI